jgi:isoquinoline 1-oxidoreductase beta subunit
MTKQIVSRRDFVVVLAMAGGGLLLGCHVGDRRKADGTTPDGSELAPNAFVRVRPDGRVTLVIAQVEMGQGTYTSLPMLIAEEMDIGLDQVDLQHAPADDELYANPPMGFQATGGSTSVRGAWIPLRRSGAIARAMLVAAAAETWKVDPTSCHVEHGVVVHALTGRRLGYGALATRAAALPVPRDVPLKEPRNFRLIGTAAKRMDAPGKVNGSAMFGIDVRLPGMAIATVAACPVFGGELAGVNDSRARAMPGVRQIVRLDDAVAVVADHMWAAKQGLAALAIEWNEGSHAALSTGDVVRQLELASRHRGAVAREDGNVATAMASAATKVEAIYQVPFLAHATMEPMNCTVHVRPDGCDVWVGTQIIGRARDEVARVTGLPAERVHVHNHLLGGGFGRRLEVDFIVQAAQIAMQVDGPVKVVWTREEDIQHDMYRPYYLDRIEAGLNGDGMPVAWSHRIVGPSIVQRWAPKTLAALRPLGARNILKAVRGVDLDAVEGAAEPPYELPNIVVDYVRQEPPGIRTAFWRGVGPTHNVFVVESFIDELATAAKRDPVEYRRALLGGSPRARAVLDLAAARAGWNVPLPAGHGRGVSVQQAFGSYLALIAEVQVSPAREVRVHRVVCAVDCGVVVNPDTVRAQIEGGVLFGIGAALFSEITIKNGRVEQSNFSDYRALRINEAPAIEVHLVASDEFPGGVGEVGTSGAAPAVANAVFSATGKRVRKLPLSPANLS